MGGSNTAIFTQVVHFYPDGVGHITVGGNNRGGSRNRIGTSSRAAQAPSV